MYIIFVLCVLRCTYSEAYAVRLPRSWKNGCEDLIQIFITFSITFPILPIIHFLLTPLQLQFFTSLMVPFANNDEHTTLDYNNTTIPKIFHLYGAVITAVILVPVLIYQIICMWTITFTFLFVTSHVTISAFVFNSAIKQMT